VATESFFERGLFLKTHHPQLYDVLAWYTTRTGVVATGGKLTAGRHHRRERRRSRREAERKLRRSGSG